MTTLVDGIGADASAILAHFGPRQPVATYINGWRSVWTPREEAMFASKIRISVEPNQPAAAKYARVLDVERYDARPADVGPFIAEREAAGHQDGTIYCSLDTVPLIEPAAREIVQRWWLAWYWGRPLAPSVGDVLAELERLTGVVLPASRIWAVQWQPGPQWDLSAVYGRQDWSR